MSKPYFSMPSSGKGLGQPAVFCFKYGGGVIVPVVVEFTGCTLCARWDVCRALINFHFKSLDFNVLTILLTQLIFHQYFGLVNKQGENCKRKIFIGPHTSCLIIFWLYLKKNSLVHSR